MASGDMSPNTARKLAALIVAGAEQLEEKAQQRGVTAFVGRAVQREKPNERFLQNTLKNLASANRRADERVMWAAWEAQKQLQEDGSTHNRQQRHKRTDSEHGHSSKRRRADDGGERCSRDNSRREHGRSRERRDRIGRSRHHSNRSSDSSRSAGRGGGRSSSREQKRQRVGIGSGGGAGAAAAAAAAAAAEGDAETSSRSSSSSSGDDSPGPIAAAGDRDKAHSSSFDRETSDAAEAPAGPEASDEDDQQLLQWLSSSKRVRGRGEVGPRADMPGPYLKPPDGLNPAEAQQLDQGLVRGPARPTWLKKDEEEQRRLVPNAGFLRGVMRAQGIVSAGVLKQGIQGNGRQQRSRSRSNSQSSSSSSGSEDGGKHRRSSKKCKKHKRKHKHSGKHKKKKHKKSRHKD